MSVTTAELTRTFRSMASPVELRVLDPLPGASRALERATERIHTVARHLTRFEVESALSAMNRSPQAWNVVPAEVADAVEEAHRAYLATRGRFDPRVLDALVAWGYDTTFAMVLGDGQADPVEWPSHDGESAVPARPVPSGPWAPDVLRASDMALVRPETAIDLGGIGKGLAVRWAAAELATAGAAFLVDAGGDEWLGGAGPNGDGWMVGVENPFGSRNSHDAEPEDPVFVLRLADCAVATSSTRRRQWRAGGEPVHHLVDPRTGLPGGAGLAQVTVVHADPAWAEIWSKTLFLSGTEIAERAEADDLAAAWVMRDGTAGVSEAMGRHVVWESR
jgi:FAD:protein FMN transferase